MGEKGKEAKLRETAKPIVRTYKDTVFRMVFKEKRELLSLFNAINGTQYDNPDDLEINTLENAIYMSMKNDISCVLDMQMNLYEHQSTVNPNMPLRNLYYVSRLYEKITLENDISGYNRELAENCKTLFEYIQYTERVRQYSREMPLKEAVEKSVEECINENILAEFYEKTKRR